MKFKMAASMCRRLFTKGMFRSMISITSMLTRSAAPYGTASPGLACSTSLLTSVASSPWSWTASRSITNYRPNTRYLIYKRDKFREAIAKIVIQRDIQEAKKITNEDVPARFYRFANGLWLRAKAGRQRKMWQKSRQRRGRNKQFVFCNRTQSNMLDGMVTMEYKTRRYYPDDPLQKFQDRNYCGLKEYPGHGFLKRHQKKFREPSATRSAPDEIHESFGVNRHKPSGFRV